MDPTIQRAFEAARLAEASNRIGDAAQIYEYVVQTFPESDDAHQARTELFRLRNQNTPHVSPPNRQPSQPPLPDATPGHAPVANGHPVPPASTGNTPVAEVVEHAQYKARVFPAKKKYRSGYTVSRVIVIFGIISILLSVGLGLILNQISRTDTDILIGIASVAGLFFGGTIMILLGLLARAIFDTANVNRRVAELLDVHTTD